MALYKFRIIIIIIIINTNHVTAKDWRRLFSSAFVLLLYTCYVNG